MISLQSTYASYVGMKSLGSPYVSHAPPAAVAQAPSCCPKAPPGRPHSRTAFDGEAEMGRK